jgi:RNA polymerase sigma factor (sigma-70 family)
VLAEELAQETFFRATRAFLGWKGGAPAAWLLAIARNVLTDEARRGRRLAPMETMPEPAPGTSLEHGVAVRDLLARLPRSQRTLLELIHEGGFTHAEIAAMSGTTPGAIKTAAYRSRLALLTLYQQE